MSEYTDPGPFGADTDDAVSALMDGELAGFAADHGLELASVRATLEGWHGLDARRAQLGAAGSALQTPVVLDDATRSAMIARALAVAAEPTPAPVIELAARRRWPSIVGRVAAAAAVLVVAIGAVGIYQELRTDTGSTTSKPAAPNNQAATADAIPSGAGTPATGAPGTAVTAITTGPSNGATPDAADDATKTAPTAGLGEIANPQTLSGVLGDRLTNPGPLSPTACPDLVLFPSGTTITLRAPATFNGRSVEVSVARQGAGNVAFVVDPTSCSVVSAVAL